MYTNVVRPSLIDSLTPFAVGDLLYANTTTTLTKLAIGSSNNVLIVTGGLPAWSSTLSITSLTLATPLAASSGGTGVANTGTLTFDSTVNLTDSGTIDLNGWITSIPASGTFAIQEAANIFSGGVTLTTAALTITDVNIVLSTSTGTKIGTATTQKLAFFNSTPIVKPTGDVITGLQNLGLIGTATISATALTGIVPSANGGTGVNNAGTITNASNTTITGGGIVALGGFTLTVPATGTAALLTTANTLTLVNTFSNATDATALGTGAVVLSAGGLSVNNQLRVGGNAVFGTGSALINVALNGAAATSRDIRFQTAGSLRWFFGADSTAESGSDAGSNFFLTARTDAGGNIDSPITISRVTAGIITLGGSTGRQVSVATTTDSTSITTGSVITAGGIGVAKRLTLDGGTGKTIKYVNGTANAAVAVTFGAVGPTGSTAGNQVGWVRIDIGGTDRYIPYW